MDALKNGAKTFKDVQKITGASTANECEVKNPTGKCCSPYIIEIIKREEGIREIKTCCERR